jgi:amino acid adenylation domain-containing protein/FkbM family methyltransferase
MNVVSPERIQEGERPPSDRCLHELIEEQAARTPDQAAVTFEQRTLTYAQLDRRAGQLARELRRLEVGPGTLVGLFVERSVEMMVGILAILKAGAAWVPIDPAYPRDRIDFMLSDAGVAVLVTQDSLLPGLPVSRPQVLRLDAITWSDEEARAPGHPRAQPGDLCYVIYTSGSTGRPKGVGIEHRNIVSYVLGIAERLRLEPGMSYATVSTIAADLGHTAIFPALATGGHLHVISQERAESAALLSEYFQRELIDVLKIVPSHLAALQAGPAPSHVMPRKRLILGGEASRLDWIERLRALAPNCEIYNHYGPTETTVGVLTFPVGSSLPPTQSGTLPLGHPLPNSRVYVLDGDGQPVAAGEPGELCIAGSGVARGYLNRPDLTAERFVPDALGPHPGGRMYRTGDLARYLPDGTIEFCGRMDDQIKLHGYRVELGEIEGALRQHGGVREVVVLAPEDDGGGRRLVAYVVPDRAEQPLWGKAVHVLPDGSPVAHLNRNETDYIYNEIFVLQAYLRHGITIGDGDCIVDAGANVGLFTVFASRLARDLRIFAFEPNPAAFACLKANAEAWGRGVKCLPLGLSRANGSAELTFFEGLSLLSGFYADAATEREVVKNYVFNQQAASPSEPEEFAADLGHLIEERLHARTVSAQLRTLSDIIAEEGINGIDLLKINVEKSELDVLLGIAPHDWPRIRQLVIEVDQQEHLAPITGLLEKHGFEVLVEQDPLLRRTELCYVYAIHPAAGRSRLARQEAGASNVRALPPVDGSILTPATLRRHLKARLPQYMVPSAYVLLDGLPLTANGKIDRQALPAFSSETVPTTPAVVGPATETERALAAIWAELLKVESVGAHDDFFDLGGQSLLAIRAVSRIRDVFEVDLPLRNLFEHPTVAGLAEVIDGLSFLAKAQAPMRGAGDREEIEL